jgi:4-hydroxy-tetrahydrodipicolinate reductase
MGSGMGRMILTKKGMRIVSAVAATRTKSGRDLAQVLGVDGRIGVLVGSDPDAELSRQGAEVVLISTTSFTREVFPQVPQVKLAIEKGLDVITIAEEMAYPWVREPDRSRASALR